MNKTIYLKNSTDQKGLKFTVALIAITHKNEITTTIGISTCSPSDIFNKNVGKFQAIGRAETRGSEISNHFTVNSKLKKKEYETAFEKIALRELSHFVRVAERNAMIFSTAFNLLRKVKEEPLSEKEKLELKIQELQTKLKKL